MVGPAAELILDESIIATLDDSDLINCIDLFSQMDLPKHDQTLIWRRIKLVFAVSKTYYFHELIFLSGVNEEI